MVTFANLNPGQLIELTEDITFVLKDKYSLDKKSVDDFWCIVNIGMDTIKKDRKRCKACLN